MGSQRNHTRPTRPDPYPWALNEQLRGWRRLLLLQVQRTRTPFLKVNRKKKKKKKKTNNPSVPIPNESWTLPISRAQAPTAAAFVFAHFVLQYNVVVNCWFRHLHRFVSSSPFRFIWQKSSLWRGEFSGRKYVGVLYDLLAFNCGHGDRHAQVLCWSMGASLRFSYRRIYLVLFSLHHYTRPCGHLDGMLLIVSC